ncbi:MAG: 3-dehydroquinate synthase, partial [Candidatus Promineifilaceae bacterium]|nr:3-dehydroquinate synthase [Candidatus Promineifilaceae bacterium]
LMLDQTNGAVLSATGPVFCLSAMPEEIVERLASEKGKRPLLDDPHPEQRIRELLAERASGYDQYPQIITSNRTPQQIVEEIHNLIDKDILTIRHPQGQYEVIVGTNLLTNIRQLAGVDGPLAIVTDSNVGPLYAHRCQDTDLILTIPAGEQHKTLAIVNQLYDELLAGGLDRQGTIVALGGGVVGDVAGFVAATYLRGVNFIQCPTSLLAMVDASVGAKTGVDLPQGKNLVGAFKQPVAVLADLDTLLTLPNEEYAAGMAEVIKAGLIADPALFHTLETEDKIASLANQRDLTHLTSVVTAAIKVKQLVVEEDPFEKGRRAVLNLGHTFAHAIEQVSEYQIRHGEAVGMGLVAAANLSARLDYCSEFLQARIESVLEISNLPKRIPSNLSPTALYQAMGSDKKKANGRLRFILIRDVGDVFISRDIPKDMVLETIVTCSMD